MSYIRKIVKTRVLIVLTLVAMSSSAFAEIAVIVHPSVSQSATVKDIAKLFLGKSKTLPGGIKLIPIAVEGSGEITTRFNKDLLRKEDSQLKAYWSRLVFTGKAQPPKDIESESKVLELVAANPNMIGYISSDLVSDSVRVLHSF